MAFLAVHITVEVLAGRTRPSDAVVPFLAPGSTFYLGLGTVASDLLVVIVVTGLLRGRFASVRPAWLWRALHAVAYLCWPLAIVHGLLAGRTAKPYVDWSYGACVAVVALALVFRFAAGPRLGETAASHAGEAPAGIPAPAIPPAAPLAGPGGPGLPGPGSPFVPGSPPFVPGDAHRSCPEGRARGGGAHCPGLAVAAGPAPDHPSYPGPRWRGTRLPSPGHPDPGYPDTGYLKYGYPAGGRARTRRACSLPGDGGR